jgi:hypothetical protein
MLQRVKSLFGTSSCPIKFIGEVSSVFASGVEKPMIGALIRRDAVVAVDTAARVAA